MGDLVNHTVITSMRLSLVIRPEIGLARVALALDSMGYSRDPDPTAPEPIFPGEPELVSWSRPGSDARVIYGFTPGIDLRVLQFMGATAAQDRDRAARALPTLSMTDVERLLRAELPEEILLGIHAARELEAVHLIVPIRKLEHHEDETVAREAVQATDQLVMNAAALGSAWLRNARAKRPGRSILFSAQASAPERRQIVRWMVHERVPADPPVLEVLRSALEDPDWEVRATALLAAGRLGAARLRSELNQLDLLTRLPAGLDAIDRGFFASARQAVLAILDGRVQETHLSAAAIAAYPAQAHLARCILGQPVDRFDRTFLMVHALTTPLPEQFTAPPALPAAAADELLRLGIELAWVAPVKHWLGDDEKLLRSPNPIRQWTPARGFFIAAEPLSAAQMRKLGQANSDAEGSTPFEQAEELVATLTRRLGVRMRLPSADERECAVRGTDGRRYPVGMTLVESTLHDPTPWGLRAPFSTTGEWTRDSSAGTPMIAGGRSGALCAARWASTTGLARVRPVLEP